jgi:GH25 family lysozyme M1 (1,4-beta-N-acetylmuramidase)
MAASAQGLDVSNFQGRYRWAGTQGLSFGIHRLTQGLPADHANSPDPTAQWNHTEIAKKGLIRGAYHFLNPAESGAAQAHYFVSQYAALGFGQRDLFFLDNEDAHGQSPPTVAMCAQAFMRELDKLVPHNPRGVYTFISFGKGGYNDGLSGWPLWLAYPSATAPQPPPPWTRWTFWQWGIRNGIDVDAFNGTEAKLADWVAGFAPAPTPPTGAGKYTADGSVSLRTFAHAHGRTVQEVIWETSQHTAGGYGPAQQDYVAGGDWDALMPQGMIVWLP